MEEWEFLALPRAVPRSAKEQGQSSCLRPVVRPARLAQSKAERANEEWPEKQRVLPSTDQISRALVGNPQCEGSQSTGCLDWRPAPAPLESQPTAFPDCARRPENWPQSLNGSSSRVYIPAPPRRPATVRGSAPYAALDRLPSSRTRYPEAATHSRGAPDSLLFADPFVPGAHPRTVVREESGSTAVIDSGQRKAGPSQVRGIGSRPTLFCTDPGSDFYPREVTPC